MFIRSLFERLKLKNEMKKQEPKRREPKMHVGDYIGMVDTVYTEHRFVWRLSESEIVKVINEENEESYCTFGFGLLNANVVDRMTDDMQACAESGNMLVDVYTHFGLNDITRAYAERMVARANEIESGSCDEREKLHLDAMIRSSVNSIAFELMDIAMKRGPYFAR